MTTQVIWRETLVVSGLEKKVILSVVKRENPIKITLVGRMGGTCLYQIRASDLSENMRKF